MHRIMKSPEGKCLHIHWIESDDKYFKIQIGMDILHFPERGHCDSFRV